MTNIATKSTKKKTPSKRIAKLIARHLRYQERGKAAFDAAQKALDQAVKLGVETGEPIELRTTDDEGKESLQRVMIIDNVMLLGEKGAIYRPARFPRYLVDTYRDPKARRSGEQKEAA